MLNMWGKQSWLYASAANESNKWPVRTKRGKTLQTWKKWAFLKDIKTPWNIKSHNYTDFLFLAVEKWKATLREKVEKKWLSQSEAALTEQKAFLLLQLQLKETILNEDPGHFRAFFIL